MKIKTAVGVALIIFILIFGNIIAFGYFGIKLTKYDNPVNYSNTSESSANKEKTKVNSTTDINQTVNNTKTQTNTTKPKPVPPPVTRAS